MNPARGEPGGERAAVQHGAETGASGGRPVPGLTAVLHNAEFRGLWLAEALSIAGDQLAKVALAVMVYARTGSALRPRSFMP